MSPVAGFKEEQVTFLRDMRARGLGVAQSSDALSELMANQPI
jgi:hypothetical protein